MMRPDDHEQDPHLRSRGVGRELRPARASASCAWSTARSARGASRRSASPRRPQHGEHTREICATVLGLSEPEIEALLRGRRPRGAAARRRSAGGMKGRTAIAGLGMTEMGKVYGRTATDFAAEALALALDDAGLAKADVDGLLINANHSAEMAPMLQMSLGLEDLTLVNAMSAYGSSAGAMLQYAAHAITTRAGERRRLPVRRRAAVAGRLDLAVGLQRPRHRRRRPASRACASPTATTGRRTRATRSRAAGTCTCTARRTTSSGRSPSASARGRS